LLDRVDVLFRGAPRKARAMAAEVDRCSRNGCAARSRHRHHGVYYVLGYAAGLEFALPIGILTGPRGHHSYVGVVTG